MANQVEKFSAVVEVAHDRTPFGQPDETFETPWEPWFAWYPVKLYMSPKYAWLRQIYRRCVTKSGFESCDYTDSPEAFPNIDTSGPGRS